ncbi:MFS transporter [Mesorhizobium sp. BR1-1-16]|uniref:MFS transporter n=1 Tax=Mesorhizobium sp. BR1-1-16 TaxID=2876653 RepID=UPI001CC94A1C|nr:MFS transporter [Mesorhizobium sp. BR1-1-16]MBZ9936923.1 MFS transporter [Mesorhizobium sp. BR1-1-16]
MNERVMIEPAQADERSSAAGWYAVTVLSLALLLSFTDRLVINLVVDPIRRELSLSDLQISLLQGAGFAVIFALAGLPCGRLADRANRRNLIAGGVALWSAATIACGLATDFSSFFAARVGVGLGEAALVPSASSLIISGFPPHRRGIALGVFSLGATFGTGAALFVGGILLSWSAAGLFDPLPLVGGLAPWRQMFVFVGAPGFLLLPLLLVMAEPLKRQRSDFVSLQAVLRGWLAENGAVLRVALVKGALGIGDYALVSWLPTLLQRSYALSPLEAGGLVAFSITTSGVIASLAGGALSDWLARRHGVATRVVLFLGCYTLTSIAAVATFFAATPAQLALAFAAWALGSISGYVIGHVVMQESVPNGMRATTIALSLTITALVGIGLGPTLVPLVAAQIPGGHAMQKAMAAVALGASLAAFVIILPPLRRGFAALRTEGRS